MMSKFYISFLPLFFALGVDAKPVCPHSDTLSGNNIYATINGLKNDNPFIENVFFHVKSEGENYLIVDKFENLSTGEVVKDVYNIWGVKYKNEYYFHLSNARGINGLKNFIKIDKEEINNSFLTFSINCKTPVTQPTSTTQGVLVLVSIASSSVAGNLSMMLLIASKDMKSDKYWVKKNGEGSFIYYIDTQKSLAPIAKKLNKKKLKKLFPNDKKLHKRIDNSEILYEEAMILIRRLGK